MFMYVFTPTAAPLRLKLRSQQTILIPLSQATHVYFFSAIFNLLLAAVLLFGVKRIKTAHQ